jgi:tRNA pseudouridine38-40 synthase
MTDESRAREVDAATKFEAHPLQRVRLELSYDGGDFHGWAVQPGCRTVQAVVQEALARVLGQPDARLTVAGRTDAGVHATGQVAHLDVPQPTWDAVDDLVRRMNGVLPPDVVVRSAVAAPPEFDARFSALWRRYEYCVDDSAGGGDPRRRREVHTVRHHLDTEAMAAAASSLVGLRDFTAFCRRREGATALREVQEFRVRRASGLIVCTVQADAFCHSMVRSLVGALLAVGAGRRDARWPASLLDRAVRADEVAVAPAHGLTLVAVGYPPDGELDARSQITRARRGLIQPVSPADPNPDGSLRDLS